MDFSQILSWQQTTLLSELWGDSREGELLLGHYCWEHDCKVLLWRKLLGCVKAQSQDSREPCECILTAFGGSVWTITEIDANFETSDSHPVLDASFHQRRCCDLRATLACIQFFFHTPSGVTDTRAISWRAICLEVPYIGKAYHHSK